MRNSMKQQIQSICVKLNIPTNSTVFLRQFTTYALLLALVVGGVAFASFWAIDDMVDGTEERLDAASISMATAMDAQINAVVRVVNELAFDYDITCLMKTRDWYSAENQLRIKRINNNLLTYPLVNNVFGGIGVCFVEHDHVLTGSAVLTFEEWCNRYFSANENAAVFYSEMMKDPDIFKGGQFLMAHQSLTMGAPAQPVYAYVKSFPINRHEHSRGLIYVQLDISKMAYADELPSSDGVLEILLENDYGEVRSVLTNRGYDGWHTYEARIASSNKGITYIIRYRFDDVMHNTGVLRVIVWITLLICLTGCIYAAYRLALRNYKPIRRLMALSITEDNQSNVANEYTLLEETLTGLNERIKMFEQTTNSVNEQMIVRNLVRGAGDPQVNLNKLFGAGPKNLYLVLIRVNDMGHLGEDGQLDCDSTLAEFAASNISTEILSREFKVNGTASNRVVYLLVLAGSDAMSKLEATSREIYLTLQNYLEMEIAIAVRAIDEETLFPTCVLLEQFLETAALLGRTGLIPEMQKAEEPPVNLSCENEGLLSKALAAGDIDAAHAHLDALNKQVQQYEAASPAYIRFHMTTLVYIMSSGLEMLILRHNLNRKRYNDLIRELPNEKSVPALFESSEQLLSLLARDISQTAKHYQIDEEQQLIAWICHEVDSQHCNPDLSVSSLANQRGVSVSYISKKFKGLTGMGLLEYIHRVRIRHGKQLMTDYPKLKVKEIAEKVGYINATSFIRAFKRYEGMTPGKGFAAFDTEDEE